MSRKCVVTGKCPVFGHNVSHSNRKTNRRFEPNLHEKRFWLEDEKRFVTLRVSKKGLKCIDRDGLKAVLAKIDKN